MVIPGRFKTVFPQQPGLKVAIPRVERVSMKYISSNVSYVWIGWVVPSGVAFASLAGFGWLSPAGVRSMLPQLPGLEVAVSQQSICEHFPSEVARYL